MPFSNAEEAKIYELDNRVSILETKDQFFEKSLTKNETDHQVIKNNTKEITKALQGIEKHIVRQNGSLPRMAEDLKTCVHKIDSQEKKLAAVGVKTKLLWAILSSVVTAVAIAVVKILLFP